MVKKNWYAVLTADLLYSKDISLQEKVLMAVISNLSNEKGYCFASNKYLAEVLNISTRSVQRYIKNLHKEGFLGEVSQIRADGKTIIRALTPTTNCRPAPNSPLPRDKSYMEGVTDCPQGGDVDGAHNNKYNNKLKNKENRDFFDFSKRGAVSDLRFIEGKKYLLTVDQFDELNNNTYSTVIEAEDEYVLIKYDSEPPPF